MKAGLNVLKLCYMQMICMGFLLSLLNHDSITLQFVLRIIVDACGVNVLYFLIKKPFRKTNFPDTFLQLGKVVHRTARLKSIVIQRKPLDNVFF